jgi:hypothetical protein
MATWEAVELRCQITSSHRRPEACVRVLEQQPPFLSALAIARWCSVHTQDHCVVALLLQTGEQGGQDPVLCDVNVHLTTRQRSVQGREQQLFFALEVEPAALGVKIFRCSNEQQEPEWAGYTAWLALARAAQSPGHDAPRMLGHESEVRVRMVEQLPRQVLRLLALDNES